MPRTFNMVIHEGRLSHNSDKKVLNPKLWEGKQMKKEVSQKLLDMSNMFAKELGLTKGELQEVLIVGGNASWAWSPESDADISLVINPSSGMTRKRFKALSKLTSLLNYELHPTLNGIDTNFYLTLRGLNNPIRNQSVYNITEAEWIQEPSDYEESDEPLILQKVNEFIEQIRNACESDDYACHKSLLARLKKFRAQGLRSKDGENSFANQVYRQLSRSGEVQKLKDHVGDLKKTLWHVVTEGTLPTRTFVPASIPVVKQELTLEELEDLPFRGNPTNISLWEECLENAEDNFHHSARLIQISEAVNTYYLARGRWFMGEASVFIRTNVDAVKAKTAITESIGRRLAQNFTSKHFSQTSRSSNSVSSRKVLGELAQTGNLSYVGDILTECVKGEHGSSIKCGCDRNHSFYPTVMEAFYRDDSENIGRFSDRIVSLSALFDLFEEVPSEEQIKSKVKDEEEEEKTEKKKRRQRGDNPGDKNIVGQTHPFNVIGHTGLDGDGVAWEEDIAPNMDAEMNEGRFVRRETTKKHCVRCASSKCRCLKPTDLVDL